MTTASLNPLYSLQTSPLGRENLYTVPLDKMSPPWKLFTTSVKLKRSLQEVCKSLFSLVCDFCLPPVAYEHHRPSGYNVLLERNHKYPRNKNLKWAMIWKGSQIWDSAELVTESTINTFYISQSFVKYIITVSHIYLHFYCLLIKQILVWLWISWSVMNE